MRPHLLLCVFAAALVALPAQAARVLAVPVVASADPTLALDVDKTLADAVRAAEGALVPASEAGPVLTAVACADGALACTVERGRAAAADLVMLARTEAAPGGITVHVRLVDVVANAERGKASATAPRASVALAARAAVFQLLAPDRFVGRVAVETTQRGSAVLVDGVMRGSTPMLAALDVPPGRHEVEVRYGDALVLRKFVDVAFDETVLVKVDATEVPPEASVPSPLLFAGIALTGVGGVALASGAVMYTIALGQKARIDEGTHTPDDVTSNRIVGPASLGALGVGVVAVGAGVACIVMAQLE